MTKEEKEAVEILKNKVLNYNLNKEMKILDKMTEQGIKECEALEKVLSLLEKKDKIIDLMAEYIAKVVDCPSETEGIDMNCRDTCEFGKDEECWKIYFENKVKEN